MSAKLTVTPLSDIEARRFYDETTWGPWRLRCNALVCRPRGMGRYEYAVRLDDLTSSARVLDSVCQVARKTWATDKVLAGLVRALDQILEPQATLCGGGIERGDAR